MITSIFASERRPSARSDPAHRRGGDRELAPVGGGLATVRENERSRVPVYEESLDRSSGS